MNAKNIMAVILIALGLVMIASSGISFTTAQQTIQKFGLHVEKRDHHFIPSAVGAISVMGGIFLRLIKNRTLRSDEQFKKKEYSRYHSVNSANSKQSS
jgi:hypothetical protein